MKIKSKFKVHKSINVDMHKPLYLEWLNKMELEIVYCMTWNYRPDADRVSKEIRIKTGLDPELTPGSGGIFDVKLNGETVFSKHQVGRFPKDGEISDLLEKWDSAFSHLNDV